MDIDSLIDNRASFSDWMELFESMTRLGAGELWNKVTEQSLAPTFRLAFHTAMVARLNQFAFMTIALSDDQSRYALSFRKCIVEYVRAAFAMDSSSLARFEDAIAEDIKYGETYGTPVVRLFLYDRDVIDRLGA